MPHTSIPSLTKLSKYALTTAATLLLGLSLTTVSTSSALAGGGAPLWVEIDAPGLPGFEPLTDEFAPSYSGISGFIGGPDTADAFGFFFDAGVLIPEVEPVVPILDNFSATLSIDDLIIGGGENLPLTDPGQNFIFSLFSLDDDLNTTLIDQALTQNGEFTVSGLLGTGNHILSITTSAEDPPFTITSNFNPLLPFQQVDEPAALSIVALGLAAMGLARRRKKKQIV